MEQVRFRILPNEIISLILQSISDEYINSICQNPDFNEFCNWSFWRDRSSIKWKVPNWYFDLGLSRNISGEYRYLEVSTQFHLTPESISEIEEGTVYGIMSLESIIETAFDRRDIDLVSKLCLNSDIRDKFWEINGGQKDDSWHTPLDRVISKIYNSDLEDEEEMGEEKIFVAAYKANWQIVIDYLSVQNDIDDIGRLLTYLIYTQQEKGFDIVLKFIDKTDLFQRGKIIRASLQCGNQYQFKLLIPYIDNFQDLVKQFTSELHDFLIIGKLYSYDERSYNDYWGWSFVNEKNDWEYSFIYDAIAGANRNNYDYLIASGSKIISEDVSRSVGQCLFQGRVMNLSNPIDVYEFVNYFTQNNQFDIKDFTPLGIEVSQLLFKNFPEKKNPDVGYYCWGNDDLLNFLIVTVLGSEHKTFSMDNYLCQSYPQTTSEIFKAYSLQYHHS